MKFTQNDHTYAVCAYKSSPYIEACIKSLFMQTIRSKIIICTSTPTKFTEWLAEKYGLTLFVQDRNCSIGDDWNFAYACAGTPLVTLAHQDDLYGKHYTKRILDMFGKAKNPLIGFTNYCEYKGEITNTTRLLRIKRVMLAPLALNITSSSIWIRRRILSFGNPICCPSVTYYKDNLPGNLFTSGFDSNLDWSLWEEISGMDGDFLYEPKVSMCHRIHEGSTTSKLIKNSRRGYEDLEMFKRFWPEPIAKLIAKKYKSSEGQNE